MMGLPMTSDGEPVTGYGRTDGSARWVPAGLALLLGMMTVLWLRQTTFGRPTDIPGWLGALSALAALNGTVLLSAALVLSARLRFLESAAGGLDRQYRAHHWVGGWALALLLVHPTLLAWRYAQFSWKRAAQLWWPGNQDMFVVAGQLALYGMAAAAGVSLKPTPSIPLINTIKERTDMWYLKRYGLPFLYWNLMLRGRM